MIIDLDKKYGVLKLKSVELFSDAHNIHTSKNLVEDILNNISDLTDKEFLVLFNVEFVLSLVYTYKVDPKNITFYSDNSNKTKIVKLLGVTSIITNLTNIKRKFDAVIGNPPFQDGKNNNFYQEFVKVAFELSSDVVAMITPSNWTSFADSESNFLKLIKDNGLVTYKFLGDKAFDVQLITVYFICSKLTATGNVTVITEDDTTVIPTNGIIYFPSKTTKSLSIISNIKHLNLSGLTAVKGSLDRNKAITDPNGIKCIFSAGKKSGDYDWGVVSSSHLSDDTVAGYNTHKVVVSRVTSLGKLGEAKYAGPDYAVAQGAYYFEVNNATEADNLITYLNSKTVRLIVRELKGAVCSNSQNIFKFIPKVDLTKVWSDADLYKHFGLTQDEIDYIEDAVK